MLSPNLERPVQTGLSVLDSAGTPEHHFGDPPSNRDSPFRVRVIDRINTFQLLYVIASLSRNVIQTRLLRIKEVVNSAVHSCGARYNTACYTGIPLWRGRFIVWAKAQGILLH